MRVLDNFKDSGVAARIKQFGFGASVIQRLVKTSVKKNLYYEIKERPVEEAFNGVRMESRKRMVKVYGTDSTKDVRARCIEILYDRVGYHKDKFISEMILNEMKTMVVKKNGKVEHADGAHDDQVFSYLMALYVIYEGKNLAENYGIMRNVIKTDEEVEIEENTLDRENGFSHVDIEEVGDTEIDILQDQYQFISEASRSMDALQFEKKQQVIEQAAFDQLISTDPAARRAYEEKYSITPSENKNGGMQFVNLPDTLFMDDSDDYYYEDYGQEFGATDPNYMARNGNLFDMYSRL